MSHRLPKAVRLHGRAAIDELFKSGSRFNLAPFRVVWQLKPKKEDAPLRFGISVSKKVSRKAHERNRIKRLIREAMRITLGELQEELRKTSVQLNFFILYTGEIQAPFEEIRHKIILLLNRLKSLHEKHPKQDPDISNQAL